ncbi:class I SAM-dependent DNA methyltransferase [Peterkaempfera griseoplana]|uniref:class I SAM-dependent DNA methyltransferase n=1 Tax=Peterkaempfera griseoplana TaxID=66896 RepID=UPI0006E2E6EC|nr:class I SAM-dependent methyltransferase [Peterkaempfera griseoplana]
MKGQPSLPEELPDLYDAMADAYDRLDDWIVANWGEKPRPERADFLQKFWSSRTGEVRSVLEICCGTGLMLEQLALRGFDVTGLDRSQAMLGHARRRLGEQVPLVHAELPAIPVDRQFDAVVSPGAALNYTASREDLAATFQAVARVLRPGGSFVFDILSPGMMADHAGSTVWAADLGDLAFVWTFADSADGRYSDATYTQFLRRAGDPDGSYTRTREQHRLYTLDPETVGAVAQECGLTEGAVYDNYTFHPAHAATRYQTWAFTRA